MSSTYSTGGQTPGASHACDDCGGQVADNFCLACGLEIANNVQLDHRQYSAAGDRHEKLDRSTNAAASVDTRDHQGQRVSPDLIKRLRNANRQEKFSRPYCPVEHRQRQFDQHIRPHLYNIRSAPGDDTMMVAFKELYDVLIGQSEVLERNRLRQTNAARTNHDKGLTSRVMAAVLVHELERDTRPLQQKLLDDQPHKYSVAKNTQSHDLQQILQKVKTGWSEWSIHAFETIRKYALTLLKHLNRMYSVQQMQTQDAVKVTVGRRKHGVDERNSQLEHMFAVVCRTYAPLASGIPSTTMNTIHSILNDTDNPSVQRYPMMDKAPNYLIKCQLEIVLHVLQRVYPDAKMKRTKVHRALREGSNLHLPPSPCSSRTYKNVAEFVASRLEA